MLIKNSLKIKWLKIVNFWLTSRQDDLPQIIYIYPIEQVYLNDDYLDNTCLGENYPFLLSIA